MSKHIYVQRRGWLRHWVRVVDYPREATHIRYGRRRSIAFANRLAEANGLDPSKVYVNETYYYNIELPTTLNEMYARPDASNQRVLRPANLG